MKFYRYCILYILFLIIQSLQCVKGLLCGVAITGILVTIIKWSYDLVCKFLEKKINWRDNYIIINNQSKLYNNFIKYLYENYVKETKGCKVNHEHGMFNMLIEELKNGELTDTFEDKNICISFQDTSGIESSKEESKKAITHKDIVIRCKGEMKVLEDYLKHTIRQINSNKRKDVYMYKLKAYGNKKKSRDIVWIKNKFVTNKTMQNTIVPDNVKKMYYDDMTNFIGDKERYFKKGIPFKRGYLLHGEPGCGKTSLIKAVAHDFNLPIFMLDLSVLHDNSEVLMAMNELNYHINTDEPYLLVLEDIDRTKIFKSMKKDRYGYEYEDEGTEKGGITQDCILNILDGIDESHGRITIITTNDFDKIKRFKSLVRPGRIDVSLNITFCTRDQIISFIKYYFEECPFDESKISDDITITPAQLLQIMYLLNDIQKVIITLTTFTDFIHIDIEKKLLEMKWITEDDKDEGEEADGETITTETVKKVSVKKKTVSVRKTSFTGKKFSVKRHRSKYGKRVHPQERKVFHNNLIIDRLDKFIKKNQEKILLDQNKIDKNNQLNNLRLEANKLKVQIMEIQKDKYAKENIQLELLLEERKKNQPQGRKKKTVPQIKSNDQVLLKLIEDKPSNDIVEEIKHPIEDIVHDDIKNDNNDGTKTEMSKLHIQEDNNDDDDYSAEFGQLESLVGLLKS